MTLAPKPLIVAYYDGDAEVQILSNFAVTPFVLDGLQYKTVEGFWQSLKTEDEVLRQKIRMAEGFDAKQMGRKAQTLSAPQTFTYLDGLYTVGSMEHHILLERAIRAKTAQNAEVRETLLKSYPKPLKHMLRNQFGRWRSGDSPALPAISFEKMLMRIRDELVHRTFNSELERPSGINTWAEDIYEKNPFFK
jgi:predicted NAD-dependent protein-ADP-ribosyltransferase YbiA (DUF1768 family)